METSPVSLAIFASGAGSNARKIIDYFRNSPQVQVSLVLTNKKDAGVTGIAAGNGIETLIFGKEDWAEPLEILERLRQKKIEWIILAGFLWKMPDLLVQAYAGRMVNIHPALLPRHGGKGMYGMHVHRAVKEAGDTETGITIHYVNENYDEGAVIHQEKVSVEPSDTPESIAAKVQHLEHHWYPRVIEQLVSAG